MRHIHKLLFVGCTLLLMGCIDGKPGNGVPGERAVKVGSPVAVESHDNIDIIVSVDDRAQPSAVALVRGDDNLLADVDLDLDGGVLRVSAREPLAPELRLQVVLVLPTVVRAETFGSGDIFVSGLSGQRLDLATFGSGEIDARGKIAALSASTNGSGNIHVNGVIGPGALTTSGSGDISVHGFSARGDVRANTHGSGDIDVSGQALSLFARTEGSGNVAARDLEVGTATIQTHGSGDIRVCATQFVDGRTHGSGDIHVHCQPDGVSLSERGSGDVKVH